MRRRRLRRLRRLRRRRRPLTAISQNPSDNFFSNLVESILGTISPWTLNTILLESFEVGQIGLKWPKIGLFFTKCPFAQKLSDNFFSFHSK